MKVILAIGSGSFIGGVSRYLLSQFIQTRSTTAFPFGTLGVNLIGCLLIGIVFGISDKSNMGHEWKMFLATGLLGGFTTFSAFSNETISMLRDGQLLNAGYYISASVVLGLAATFLGFMIVRFF
ncbi:MAG: fluoride efflux transporter CrcB [Bacteroidota bacterium]